mmetsp:Transcript_16264/g.24948  ORF Transcript_16264/g.24948 Transcript_16264/m.24948 type:complete len:276 (+) Transcript_16264:152-979(+)
MKLKDYLVEQNVSAADVGSVLIMFKLCAWSTWVLSIPICSKLKPLRRMAQLSGPQKLKQAIIRRYPNKIERFEESIIKSSEWFANHRATRWIPDSFGQKRRDFGLSVAEATVLYKLLFPVWAPLEFLYIVRLYKRKWGMRDLLPTHSSVLEYTDSYAQASLLDPLQLMHEDDDDDDNNNGNKNGGGSGGGNGGGPKHNGNGPNAHLMIHTCSSSMAHCIGLLIEHRNRIRHYQQQLQCMQRATDYRYRLCATHWLRHMTHCFTPMTSLMTFCSLR